MRGGNQAQGRKKKINTLAGYSYTEESITCKNVCVRVKLLVYVWNYMVITVHVICEVLLYGWVIMQFWKKITTLASRAFNYHKRVSKKHSPYTVYENLIIYLTLILLEHLPPVPIGTTTKNHLLCVFQAQIHSISTLK